MSLARRSSLAPVPPPLPREREEEVSEVRLKLSDLVQDLDIDGTLVSIGEVELVDERTDAPAGPEAETELAGEAPKNESPKPAPVVVRGGHRSIRAWSIAMFAVGVLVGNVAVPKISWPSFTRHPRTVLGPAPAMAMAVAPALQRPVEAPAAVVKVPVNVEVEKVEVAKVEAEKVEGEKVEAPVTADAPPVKETKAKRAKPSAPKKQAPIGIRTSATIASLERALAQDPTSLPARLGLADTLWDAGRRDVAATQYREIRSRFASGVYPARVVERTR